MPTIYQLDEFGQWTGEVREIDEAEGFAPDWVAADAPPAVPAGQAAVWISGEWKLRTEPLISGFGLARVAKRAAIDAAFQVRNTANFPWDFGSIEARDDLGAVVGPAGVRSLQIRDLEDKTNWTAAHTVAMAAVALGASATIVPLKCDDNVWVQTTAVQAMQVLALGEGPQASLFQRQASTLARYGTLKKLWAEAANHADLDAIDETAGWPLNLGEDA